MDGIAVDGNFDDTERAMVVRIAAARLSQ